MQSSPHQPLPVAPESGLQPPTTICPPALTAAEAAAAAAKAPSCLNRVVQGGLCIAHGAKRKTCSHPGCTKNVKKASKCSQHGPTM